MSRQIRITIDDDEVFERLRRRKDALDLSWEDALRRGLRDSPDPPRAPDPQEIRTTTGRTGAHGEGSPERRERTRRERRDGDDRGPARTFEVGSPVDPDLGERIARQVVSSVAGSIPDVTADPDDPGTIDDEIDRLEDAEDAVLVLGDDDGERVPLRVSLHTGPEGLDVEVVAVRHGKDTEGMNRFADGARAAVARRFAAGDTATLELADGEEVYEVRPDLEWARGDDGVPTVTDVTIRDVVFED